MSESEFVAKGPCPDCGSSDACATFSDGHTYCFSCRAHHSAAAGEEGDVPSSPRSRGDLIPRAALSTGAINSRNLSAETVERWGYGWTRDAQGVVQVATYRDPTTHMPVAQKVRRPDKTFYVLGDLKQAGLYGQHLCRDGGRRIIITEGEIDAMSVDQALGHKWQVVSVPNGAQGAKKALAKALPWLNSYQEVVLCLDQDDAGRAATLECASLFPPGKVKVVTLPLKDASEMLQAGREEELVSALWNAASHRPDGIVRVADILERVLTPPEMGLPWVFPTLTRATYGRRFGEVVALGAGTGVGKTTFMTQQIAADLEAGHPVGVFAFEQHPAETVQRVAGQQAKKLFHVPGAGWTRDELRDAALRVDAQGLYLYDHFGACEWSGVRERIRYLRHAHGVRLFYLDHLTALAVAEDDERVALERITAEMASLMKELDSWLLFVSHLSTPQDTPHEEGGRVMLRHFKGSRSIGYWAHFAFGMERNKSSDDIDERLSTQFRCLKDRFTGQADGLVVPIHYDRKTGLLLEGTQATEEPMF